MATLTAEQIVQKKQLLADKLNQMKALSEELNGADAVGLSDQELEAVGGGTALWEYVDKVVSLMHFSKI